MNPMATSMSFSGENKQPVWQWQQRAYEAGQAAIDEVDKVASGVERAWGLSRLRLFASVELRAKFDKQRYLLNDAIARGDLTGLVRECKRMINAWKALERYAVEHGLTQQPDVWEIAMTDGSVLAIVHQNEDIALVHPDGRARQVWSLEEIVKLIEASPDVVRGVKKVFCGSLVELYAPRPDPLEGADKLPLDDDIDLDTVFGPLK